MKLLLTFLLMFCAFFVQAQFEREWVRHYGQSSMSEAKGVLALEDGNFLVSGYSIKPKSARADACLIKIDGEGKRIWEQTYGGKGWDEFTSVTKAQNGEWLALGWTDSQGAGRTDAWLVRLNSFGEILWEQTYGGKKWEEAQAITATADNGAVFTTTFNPKGENDDIRIIKVDSEGAEQWHFDYSKGKRKEQAHGIVELPNKDIIFTGFTTSLESQEDGFIVKLSAQGELMWEENYGKPDMDVLHDVKLLPDGNLIAVGFGSVKEKSADLRLLKLDANGKILKEAVFGGNRFDKGRAICILPNNKIAITGFTSSEGMGKSDIWTLVCNENLKIEWQDTFGGEGRDSARSIIYTSNGELLIAGKIDLLTLSTFLVVKYQQNGETKKPE